MFFNISERVIHRIRWILLVAWLLMIVALFFDPISPILTEAKNTWSPLHIDPGRCVLVHGQCFEMEPYAIAPAIFWGIILPIAILSLLTFGHELWRRICPLSFLSQLPKHLNLQRRVRQFNPISERVTVGVPKIKPDSWLGKHHTYLQFGLLYLGLCGRILFFNATRPLLAALFISTILAAIAVGYLFAGKSWCHYFCPMAPVQTIYTQPLSLFSSRPHLTGTRLSQSMCRVPTAQDRDQSACVGCKQICLDIDGERSYWSTLNQPQQSFLRYGYWGLVMGYFAYYYLYSGTWDYYLSGVWAQDAHQLDALLGPGLYLGGQAIAIPKLLAAPLTLAAFTTLGYGIGRSLEHHYGQWLWDKHSIANPELVRHRLFCFVTFTVFHVYFAFGGRPFLQLLPIKFQYGYQGAIVILSLLWLQRVWGRSHPIYKEERKRSKVTQKENDIVLK